MGLTLKILGISHLVNSPCPGLVEAYGTTRVTQNKNKAKTISFHCILNCAVREIKFFFHCVQMITKIGLTWKIVRFDYFSREKKHWMVNTK